MIKYIINRLLVLVPVIIGISFIIFSIMYLTPGDPARLMLGDNASEEQIYELREEMGLNKPFLIQYANYAINAIRGDFGISYRNRNPVSKEISARLPTTLILTFWGITLSIIIGVPIGIISAVKQYTLIDTLSLTVAMILTSIPAFWLGLMLILYLSLNLNLLPATGVDTWKHFIMPSLTLAAGTMATLIRVSRSTMLEVIRQDYIRTARAKGANEYRIVFKHALQNALLPVITMIGINFGIQLGGAIIIETVFAMPGLGTLMIAAVRMKDTPTVMAAVLFVALAIGIINLFVDILYALIDPRIRLQYAKI